MLDYGPTSGVQPAGDIFVGSITQTGTAFLDAAGVSWTPHGWTEQRVNPNGLDYPKEEFGRSGDVMTNPTKLMNPAFMLDGSSVKVGTKVFMRLRLGFVRFPPTTPPPAPGTPTIYNGVYDIIAFAPAASSGPGSTVCTPCCCVPFLWNIVFCNNFTDSGLPIPVSLTCGGCTFDKPTLPNIGPCRWGNDTICPTGNPPPFVQNTILDVFAGTYDTPTAWCKTPAGITVTVYGDGAIWLAYCLNAPFNCTGPCTLPLTFVADPAPCILSVAPAFAVLSSNGVIG